jgi:hypothetical protein
LPHKLLQQCANANEEIAKSCSSLRQQAASSSIY